MCHFVKDSPPESVTVKRRTTPLATLPLKQAMSDGTVARYADLAYQGAKPSLSRPNFRGASILRCGFVRHLTQSVPHSANLDVLSLIPVGAAGRVFTQTSDLGTLIK